MTDTDVDDSDRIRQSERTVDNLKRLYAVLFALSFSVLATGTIEKMNGALTGDVWPVRTIFLHIEISLAFAMTAGLFYYQGDRFLDVVLAKKPLATVTAADFAFSYLVNVLTMAPFYLMAHGLGYVSAGSGGFTWYFLGYLALIINGLLWLLVRSAARVALRLKAVTGDIAAVSSFWLIMNSLMLVVVLLLYLGFARYGGPCVAGDLEGVGLWFVASLGAVILIRDGLDFIHCWPILYPVADPEAGIRSRPVIAALKQHIGLRIAAFWVSVLLVVISLYLVWLSGLWDISALRAACRVG